MLGPPLQYQSLKAVLPHMDANTRFRISLRMPAIRSVEKMLPLKINRLELLDCRTKVNGFSYQLGIFRYYPDGNVPRDTEMENRLGGVGHDFDEFGFSRTNNHVLLPGDISFQPEDRIERRDDTEVEERSYRESLRIHEKALERLTELNAKGIDVKDHLQTLEPLSNEELYGEEYRIRDALRSSSEGLLYYIECDKLELLPFDCRRNRTKPPFTCYIQLTITKGRSRMIQRFEYTKKLFEAVKHFHEVLFGSRKVSIHADNLDLILLAASNGICRLPIGFRLLANKVYVYHTIAAHKSFSLLVKNSNHLDSLWMYYNVDPNNLGNQVVQNVKRVVITQVDCSDLPRLVHVLRELPNLEISILPIQMATFSPENLFVMIQAWLRGDRRVGSSCWIGIGNEETGREILKLVRISHEKTNRTKRCVTIRRNDSTRVEVFYVPSKGPNKNHYDSRIFKWIMKIRVVKV